MQLDIFMIDIEEKTVSCMTKTVSFEISIYIFQITLILLLS